MRPSLWVHDIDPYVEPGDPESGLVPFVQDQNNGPLGQCRLVVDGVLLSTRVRHERQGYTNSCEPTNYDPAEFEVYRRAIRDGVDIFSNRHMRTTLNKFTVHKKAPFVGGAQSNRNLMGSTVYGCNENYPER